MFVKRGWVVRNFPVNSNLSKKPILQLTQSQTFDIMLKCLQFNFASSIILKIVFKNSYPNDRPLSPGRIGFSLNRLFRLGLKAVVIFFW